MEHEKLYDIQIASIGKCDWRFFEGCCDLTNKEASKAVSQLNKINKGLCRFRKQYNGKTIYK